MRTRHPDCKTNLFRRLGQALLLGIALALVCASTFAEDIRDSAPMSMVITYRTPPAQRVAFRQALERHEIPRFKRWKAEGMLENFVVTFGRHADSAAWDAMVLLTFAQPAGLARWKEIERASPAGLTSRTLALVGAIETVPGDILRQRVMPATGPAASAFLAIPYEYLVPLKEYVAYLDGYVLPQVDGWMDEEALASYAMFIARYPAGRPWQSMLVLEYRDDTALGARDALVAKVRARLKDNPQWKSISDAKKNVRNEKPPVIADALPSR